MDPSTKLLYFCLVPAEGLRCTSSPFAVPAICRKKVIFVRMVIIVNKFIDNGRNFDKFAERLVFEKLRSERIFLNYVSCYIVSYTPEYHGLAKRYMDMRATIPEHKREQWDTYNDEIYGAFFRKLEVPKHDFAKMCAVEESDSGSSISSNSNYGDSEDECQIVGHYF